MDSSGACAVHAGRLLCEAPNRENTRAAEECYGEGSRWDSWTWSKAVPVAVVVGRNPAAPTGLRVRRRARAFFRQGAARDVLCWARVSPGWSAARFNVKMLRYSVTLLRGRSNSIRTRLRRIGTGYWEGRLRFLSKFIRDRPSSPPGDRSSAGRVPAASPRRAQPSMMLPCSPVPLEPSTAIVLKKKSVRRTVRDEPGRRHRIPLQAMFVIVCYCIECVSGSP